MFYKSDALAINEYNTGRRYDCLATAAIIRQPRMK